MKHELFHSTFKVSMKISLLAILVTLTTVGTIATSPAQASVYRSASGNTELRLSERTEKTVGSYSTKIGGTTWNGAIEIPSSRETGGYPGGYRYKGTFTDSPATKIAIQCTGDLEMIRKTVGRSTQLSMTMTWTVKGGKNCPTIGKTFTMSLLEALPKADRNGDYNQSWGLWRVSAADGQLNCRANPNGKVVHTFKTGDEIFLDGRLGETISRPNNGSAWMYVPYTARPYTESNYKPCFVRANSQYITPLSLPF